MKWCFTVSQFTCSITLLSLWLCWSSEFWVVLQTLNCTINTLSMHLPAYSNEPLPCHWGFCGPVHNKAMLRSPCFTPVHLPEKIIVWLIHLTQVPFISFSGLCFTGASNQSLALRSPRSSSRSYVTILFFCSIILIPVAAPVTPYPVFSSLIFLSSLCTVPQTWDSSPDGAFSFHHLQIASQDEILSIWLKIQPKFNQLKFPLWKCE